MGLFTGHPNPGYLGSSDLYAERGKPVDVPHAASFELFDGMNWNDATIWQYGRRGGLRQGHLGRYLPDSGGLGYRIKSRGGYPRRHGRHPGGATFGTVGTNQPCSWTAYVKNRTNAFTARGLVTLMVTFILVGARGPTSITPHSITQP